MAGEAGVAREAGVAGEAGWPGAGCRGSGLPGEAGVAGGAAGSRGGRGSLGGGGRDELAGRVGVADEPPEHHRGPGRGPDGGLGRLIPRDRRAVDERVLVRMRERPATGGPARRQPAAGVIAAAACGVGALDGLADGVVSVDDQCRQQLVAAAEVPVDRRRHHAQVPGDGAQRERGGSLGRQTCPGDVGDLAGDLRASPFPGRSVSRHAPTIAEQSTQTRAALHYRPAHDRHRGTPAPALDVLGNALCPGLVVPQVSRGL